MRITLLAATFFAIAGCGQSGTTSKPDGVQGDGIKYQITMRSGEWFFARGEPKVSRDMIIYTDWETGRKTEYANSAVASVLKAAE